MDKEKKIERRFILRWILRLVWGGLIFKGLDFIERYFSLFSLKRYWQYLLVILRIPILFLLIYYLPKLVYKYFED